MLAPEPTLPAPIAPTAPDDSARGSRALRGLLAATGGFTLDHDSGRPLQRGIAVCADPALAWHFPIADWHDGRVASWISAQRSRLAEGDVHLGGWLERAAGDVWLELVWVLPDRLRSAAMAIGRMHGQHAVFDLARGQLVALDKAARENGAR